MSKTLAIILAIIIGILSFLGFTNMSSCVSDIMESSDEVLVPAEMEPEEADINEYINNYEILDDYDSQPAPVISDDLTSVTEAQEEGYVFEDDLQKVCFGSLSIQVPDSFSIESEYIADDEIIIWGEDEETGIQFEIYGYSDSDNDMIKEFSYPFDEETLDINGVPCVITYDEQEDTDICICADVTGNYIFIIGVSRPDGVNVSAEYFNTISVQ